MSKIDKIQPGDIVYLKKDKSPFRKNAQGKVTDVLNSGLIVLRIDKDENCVKSTGIVFVLPSDLIKGARCP